MNLNGKKIALFVPDLHPGGVERVRLILAESFNSKDIEVDLVLINAEGELLSQVPKNTRIVDLACKRRRNAFLPLVMYLKRVNPDVILASMYPQTSIVILAAKLARFKGKVFISEHSHLSNSPLSLGKSGILLRACIKYLYAQADGVIAVSEGVQNDLEGMGLGANALKYVINNPVTKSVSEDIIENDSINQWMAVPREKRILAVGTLKPAKDYPTMIEVMALVCRHESNPCLLIVGDGPLSSELTKLVKVKGLERNILFAGFQRNTDWFYQRASVFLFTSQWEGFGNVLVEALLNNLSVVSTDCDSGPSEILDGGKYGILCPIGEVRSLSQAVERSLEKNANQNGPLRALEYHPDTISEKYLRVFFGSTDTVNN